MKKSNKVQKIKNYIDKILPMGFDLIPWEVENIDKKEFGIDFIDKISNIKNENIQYTYHFNEIYYLEDNEIKQYDILNLIKHDVLFVVHCNIIQDENLWLKNIKTGKEYIKQIYIIF